MVIESLIKTTQKRMAVNHYENFPVASVLLPASIRTDVVNLYRFARSADDIADEGDSLPSERLRSLTQYRQALHTIGENPHLKSVGDTKLDPIFVPLAATIIKHSYRSPPFQIFCRHLNKTSRPSATKQNKALMTTAEGQQTLWAA